MGVLLEFVDAVIAGLVCFLLKDIFPCKEIESIC